ncbi:MAG: helix-turn-helix domain-containing protein [Promethearchaeota archaeon]
MFRSILNLEKGPRTEKYELLSCLLHLNKLEIDVFLHIFDNPGLDCEEIGKALNRSRSSIQRAVKKLLEDHRLITRRIVVGVTDKQTGYKYIYEPLPTIELKQKLLALIDYTAERMKEIVNSKFHHES